MKMNKCVIAVMAFIILLSDTEGIKFTLSGSRGTWDEGLRACQGVQGTLAVINNQELESTFNSQISPPFGEKIWIGSYESYTKSVWIQGCFANRTLPSVRRTKIIQNNYLVTCLEECNNSAYLGLQGQYCYCFDSIPVNREILPGRACQNPCPGEPVSPQGTPNYLSECGSYESQSSPVSVYRLARPNEIQTDNNSMSFGECYAYSVRTRTWIPGDCLFPNRPLCDIINCNRNLPLSQCIRQIPSQVSWYRARALCESNGANLAVTNVSTAANVNNMPVVGDLFYWTGLHRKQQIFWTLDNETTTMTRSGRCIAGIRNQLGRWTTTLEDCRQQYRYVCLEELIPTTSTTSSSTTSVTTSTMSSWDPWGTTTSDVVTFGPNPQPVNVTLPSGANGLFSLSTICFTCLVTVLLHIVFI